MPDLIADARKLILAQAAAGSERIAEVLDDYPEDVRDLILQYLPILQVARARAPHRVPWPEGQLGAPPGYLECPDDSG